jgi:hypothetical protein
METLNKLVGRLKKLAVRSAGWSIKLAPFRHPPSMRLQERPPRKLRLSSNEAALYYSMTSYSLQMRWSLCGLSVAEMTDSLTCHTHEDDEIAHIFRQERIVPAITSIQESIYEIRSWVDMCENQHSRICNPTPLEFSESEAVLMLIDGNGKKLVKGTTSDRYLTLSYV